MSEDVSMTAQGKSPAHSAQIFVAGTEPYAFRGSRTGILLIHGFTGSPASMVPWGRDLAARGYTVCVPRLPGHGTTWQHLNRVSWHEWYRTVESELLELNAQCDFIAVAGLSMGGALSLRLAEQFPAEINALVLVNPAIQLKNPVLRLLPYLRHLGSFPGITNDIRKLDQDEIGYSRLPLHALHSQLELWRDVRDNLHRVHAPLLMFTSITDHVLDPTSSELISANVSSSVREHEKLKDSYHVATLDHDAPFIMERAAAFIAQQADQLISEEA